MTGKTTLNFPHLDGLRFLAFFAVFVSHSTNLIGYDSHIPAVSQFSLYFLLNGDLGVNFFFTLSGFLIVYLLIKEREVAGEIKVGSFYLRRLLRIWPVYFLVLGVSLFLLPAMKGLLPVGFPLETRTDVLNPWLYVGFLGNFDYLINGISNLFAGILWSISVEEQFYLFCPWVVALVPPRRLLAAFTLIVAGSLAFRWAYAPGGSMYFKYHSLSSVLFLASGAMLACLAQGEKFLAWIGGLPRAAIVVAYVVGLASLPLRRHPWAASGVPKAVIPFIEQTLPVIAAAFFVFVIAEQNFARNSFYKIGRWEWISALGRRTYGMYCYHLIAFFFVMAGLDALGLSVVKMRTPAFFAVVIGALATTIVVSQLSYRYFEAYFLGLKSRFAVITKG